MNKMRNGNATRPGFIIGMALAVLLNLFSIMLALAYAMSDLVLFATGALAVGVVLCAIAFRLASKQRQRGTHKASETKS
jgi:hypothetical protein